MARARNQRSEAAHGVDVLILIILLEDTKKDRGRVRRRSASLATVFAISGSRYDATHTKMDSSGQKSFLLVICAARSRFKKDCGRARSTGPVASSIESAVAGASAQGGGSTPSLQYFHTGQRRPRRRVERVFPSAGSCQRFGVLRGGDAGVCAPEGSARLRGWCFARRRRLGPAAVGLVVRFRFQPLGGRVRRGGRGVLSPAAARWTLRWWWPVLVAIDAVVPAVALAVQAVMERERRGAVQKQDGSDRGRRVFHVAAARPWHVAFQLHVDDGH